jgi:signal transduction histidine kinase
LKNRHHIFLKTLLVAFAFFANAAEMRADETLPHTYIFQKEYSGQVLKTGEFTFHIQPQPAWSQEAQVAVWRGADEHERTMTTLPGVNILSAEVLNNSLLVIASRNNSVVFFTIGQQLSVSEEKPLNITANFVRDIRWKKAENGALVLVEKTLFHFENEIEKISDYAADAVFLKNGNIAFLQKNGARNIIKFLKNGKIAGEIETERGEQIRLAAFENTVVSLQTLGGITAVYFSQLSRPNYTKGRIAAHRDFVVFKKNNNATEIVFLKNSARQYELIFAPTANVNSARKTVQLPQNLVEPMSLEVVGGTIFALFRNGLVTVSADGEILSEDNFRAGEWFKNSVPNIFFKSDTLLLATPERSVFLKKEEQNFWLVHRFLQTSGRFVLPLIAIAFGLWFLKIYLRQRAVLQAVVELPTTGIVIVLDAKRRLLKINGAARKLLKITPQVPMRRDFRYYVQQDADELSDFVAKAYSQQEETRAKITVKDGAMTEEILCTALPLRSFTGVFRGLVITGADITEELEKKRLVNWAQLAHDMQTNLSVIKLNAEQFAGDDEGNSARRRKILFQIGLIMQRVRDLVTVGRSDTLDIFTVNARELCEDVLKEFDEQMFPHVQFGVEAENFTFGCDRSKMIRALRNSTENAIRALKGQPGKVVLKAWREGNHVCLSVLDTGAGMNEEVKRNMFTPYFTTGSHTGGTGIGTMIMQHVVHLHSGAIEVRSEVNKGTEIIFTIPFAAAHFKNNSTRKEKTA